MKLGQRSINTSARISRRVIRERTNTNQPSLTQYSRRFTEYFDPPSIYYAVEEFAAMVDSGMDPDHAFHMVIEKAYNNEKS